MSRGLTLRSPASSSGLDQVLRVCELQARVGQHVQEEAVALPQHDAHPVARQRLHPLDRAQVALEVGGRAHLAVGLVAVDRQLEPQLHVRRREGRAVMPQGIVPQREGPLRLRRVHGPGRGQVRAGEVEVLPAAHHQVARPEQRAAHVVQGDAARAQRVEARWRVAAVGEHHHAAVRPLGRRRVPPPASQQRRSQGCRRRGAPAVAACAPVEAGAAPGALAPSPPVQPKARSTQHTADSAAARSPMPPLS